MPILSTFPGGSGSGGGGLTLAAVTNISTLVAHGKVYVKWTDPDDIVVAGSTLAAWGGTLLIRKAGSMPTSRRDGTVVLDSKNRDAYKNSYFCDSGLTDGVTYYYKFFPYTTVNAYTDSEDDEFNAVPTAQVSGINNWNVTAMSASSEAGDGKMTVKWSDPSNTITSDGVTLATWASTTVVVKAGSYPTSKDDAGAVFTRKVTTRNQYATNPLTVTGLTNGTKYYIAFYPETTDGGINTNTAQRTTGTANRITISAVPSQKNSLTYNGSSQSPTWNDYDTAKMTIGGTTSATNAGSHNAAFTPNSDYRWSDGTITEKTVAWSIAKAAGSLSLSESSVTLDATTKSTTVTATRAGDGVISAVSNNTSVATVSVSGNVLTINSVNDTSGDATITVSVAEGTNYLAPSSKTVSVTAKFIPSLNDASWADISTVAAAGQAANYWAVGDRKGVAINGTIGTLSVNGTYYVYILGFAHHGATNTIDFGTFKTALTGGADICLCDSKYGSNSSDGTKYFNLNHWGGSSSPYNTNYGGWKGCDARYDVLGSTNKAPSGYGSTPQTSRVGYDAEAATTTSPVANTLMAALPADLRAVLKPMTIYTDNKGNSSNVVENVTTSVDYLPLLSEFEIFGTRSYANQYEQNQQEQYQYYKNGNSKVKNKHNDTSSAALWWERSPFYNNARTFCFVYTDGTASNDHSRRSSGLAPAFRV